MVTKPKLYQKEALSILSNTRAEGLDRALVVMASGLGKTVLAAFDVEQFFRHNKGGKVLILAHSNEILFQDLRAFRFVLGNNFSYGVYNCREKTPEADFLFASFQTMSTHKKEFDQNEFRYIIVDEAHHAPANTYQKVIDYFHPNFLLGITATPNRLDGASLEDTFGLPVYDLGLAEAIARHLLVNIDYHLILDEMADLTTVLVDGEKLSMTDLNKRLFIPKRDEEIARIITEKAPAGGSMLVFCCSIAHARAMHKLLPNSGIVHSRRSAEKNDETLAAFRRGDLSTIISVDMLNEGIDIPHADTIVFLRSTVSPIVFTQQLGRGLRLHEGKKKATVLDFVCNVDRLQTVHDLKQSVGKARFKLEEQDEKESFTLDIDAPQFYERKIDMDALINIIRQHTYVCGYTKEELISQVQNLAKKLGRTPTAKDFSKDPDTASTMAVRNIFGTWNNFLKEAGLEVNIKMGYTKEELIAQVQNLAKKLGRTLTGRDFDKDPDTVSTVTVRNIFGTWNNFLKEAGLEVNRKMDYTKDELILQVQNLAKKLGRIPTGPDFDKDPDTASTMTVSRFFGTWNNFLKEAGLGVNHKMDYTKDELILQVQNLAKKLGRTPTATDFNKDPDMATSVTASKFFGSWNNFLKEAGLEVNLKMSGRLTKDELITQVQNLAKKLGRTPTGLDFDKDPDTASSSTPIKSFGTWNNFLKEAGLEVNRKMDYTKDELILQVQNLAKKLGRIPTGPDFDKDPDTASSSTPIRSFGTWNNFLKEAGLEVNRSHEEEG